MSTVHVLRLGAFVCACAVAAHLIGANVGWAAEGGGEGEAQAAPLTPGAEVFRDSCSVCHRAESGAPTIVAPNLFGIVGRQSATQADYFYSPAMREANLIWDEVTLSGLPDGTATGRTGYDNGLSRLSGSRRYAKCYRVSNNSEVGVRASHRPGLLFLDH